MLPDEAEKLLRLLGADKIKHSSSGDYLHFRCPFAPYKNEHQNHIDQSPSAWMSFSGFPVFGCWTCTPQNMSMTTVVEHINLLSGGKFGKAVDFARNLDKTVGHKSPVRVYLPFDRTTEYTERLKNRTNLPTDFLTEKGTTKQSTIDAFKIGTDTKRGLVLFPIITREQVVVGAQARSFMNTSAGGKYFSYYEDTSKSHHLFGEHLLELVPHETESGLVTWDFTGNGIIVFEGPLDCMHAYDVGLRNVVAIMGSKIADKQMDLLIEYIGGTDTSKKPKTVHFVLDPDAAGRTGMAASVQNLFVDKNPNINVIGYLAPKDPKQLTKQEFIDLLTGEQTLWEKQPTRNLLQFLLKAGKRRKRRSPSTTS